MPSATHFEVVGSMAKGLDWVMHRLDSRARCEGCATWRGAGSRRCPLAIVDEAVCKFCFRAATLDKYLPLLHSDFPRHDGHFDRLVGAQSIYFGLTTGSGENR